MMIRDALNRPLHDLRISVTDRCNFRCTYCMPKEVFGRDFPFLPRKEILTFEEITRTSPERSLVEPLLNHARHFHCRGGAKGRLQVNFQDNVIDYRRVMERMREVGYDGYFAIEYTWQDWQYCKKSDNTCETILFRDFAREVMRHRVPSGCGTRSAIP